MRASEFVSETWSAKYKRSIDCSNPKGFSQRAHCQGRKKNEDLTEFAPNAGGQGGNYLQALASAWYNHDIDMLKDIIKRGGNALNRIIDAQEAVEKILARGIHCGDGKVRKYSIGYNPGFDGVIISSDDYYNHSDHNDAGQEVDDRTGQPWGPYDYVEFQDNDLDESQLNELTFKGSPCTKDCSGHRAGYEWSQRKGGVDAASWSPSFNNGAALFKNGF